MDKTQQPPQGTPMGPRRHDFNEKQRKRIEPLIERGREIQNRISWFMDYIADEADLPKAPAGYSLQFDEDGTPYMLGQVPIEAAK
jgi:hypothetical protein